MKKNIIWILALICLIGTAFADSNVSVLYGYDYDSGSYKILATTSDGILKTDMDFMNVTTGNLTINPTGYICLGGSCLNAWGSFSFTYSNFFNQVLNTTSNVHFDSVNVTSKLIVKGLASCDTIDTDANGTLKCGTDATGGGTGNTTLQIINAVNNTALNATNFYSLRCDRIIGETSNLCTLTDTDTNTWNSSIQMQNALVPNLTDLRTNINAINMSIDFNGNSSEQIRKAINETKVNGTNFFNLLWSNIKEVPDYLFRNTQTLNTSINGNLSNLNGKIGLNFSNLFGSIGKLNANITKNNATTKSNLSDLNNRINGIVDTNTWNTSTQMRKAVTGIVNSSSWNRTGNKVILAHPNDVIGIGASGVSAVSLGLSNTATGDYGVALGTGSSASYESAVAIGTNCVSSQFGTTCLGRGNTVSGSGSFSSGGYNVVSGKDSSAMGRNVLVVGNNSFGFGGFTLESGELEVMRNNMFAVFANYVNFSGNVKNSPINTTFCLNKRCTQNLMALNQTGGGAGNTTSQMIYALAGNLSALRTNISLLHNLILRNNVSVWTNISLLNEEVQSAIGGGITVGQLDAKVGALNHNITINNNTIKLNLSNLNGRIGTNFSNIKTNISNLNSRIGLNISNWRTNISTFRSNISDLKTNIRKINNTMNQNNATIKINLSELNGRIDLDTNTWNTSTQMILAVNYSGLLINWSKFYKANLSDLNERINSIIDTNTWNTTSDMQRATATNITDVKTQITKLNTSFKANISNLNGKLGNNITELKNNVTSLSTRIDGISEYDSSELNYNISLINFTYNISEYNNWFNLLNYSLNVSELNGWFNLINFTSNISELNHHIDLLNVSNTPNTTRQMIVAVNYTALNGSRFMDLNCSQIIFNNGKGSEGICDGLDASSSGGNTTLEMQRAVAVNITALRTNITWLRSNVTSFRYNVSDLKTNIKKVNFTLLANITNINSKVGTNITDLRSNISLLNQRGRRDNSTIKLNLSNLNGRIGLNFSKIFTSLGLINTNTTNIYTSLGKVNTNTTSIWVGLAKVNINTSNIFASLTKYHNNITAMNASILRTNVTMFRYNVSDLKTNIRNLNITKQNTTNQMIYALRGNLSGIRLNLTWLRTNVTSFRYNVSDLKTNIRKVNTSIVTYTNLSFTLGKLRQSGRLNITTNVNMTVHNISSTDCIIFKSGGKICTGV